MEDNTEYDLHVNQTSEAFKTNLAETVSAVKEAISRLI